MMTYPYVKQTYCFIFQGLDKLRWLKKNCIPAAVEGGERTVNGRGKILRGSMLCHMLIQAVQANEKVNDRVIEEKGELVNKRV